MDPDLQELLIEGEIGSAEEADDLQRMLDRSGMSFKDTQSNPDLFLERTQRVSELEEAEENKAKWLQRQAILMGFTGSGQIVGGILDGINNTAEVFREGGNWLAAISMLGAKDPHLNMREFHPLGEPAYSPVEEEPLAEPFVGENPAAQAALEASLEEQRPFEENIDPRSFEQGPPSTLDDAHAMAEELALFGEGDPLPTIKGERGVVRDVANFVTSQVILNLILGPVGAGKKAFASRALFEGATVDFFAFKHDTGNLADLLSDFLGYVDEDSEIEPALRDYLGTREETGMITGRLKNALTNAGFGFALPSLLKGFKRLRDDVVWFAGDFASVNEGLRQSRAGLRGQRRSRITDQQTPTDLTDASPESAGELVSETELSHLQRDASLSGVKDFGRREADKVEAAARAEGQKQLLEFDEEGYKKFIEAQSKSPEQVFDVDGFITGKWSPEESADQIRRGGGAYHVNWKYVETYDQMKQIVNDFTESIYPELQKLHTKGKTNHVDQLEEAFGLGQSFGTVASLPERFDKMRVEVLATRILQYHAFQRLADLSEQFMKLGGATPDHNLIGEIQNQYKVTRGLALINKQIGTTAGQVLNSFQIPIKGDAEIGRFFAHLDEMGGVDGVMSMAALMSALRNASSHGPPIRTLRTLDVITSKFGPTTAWTRDLVTDIAVQGLIGTLVTVGKNGFGNSYMWAEAPLRRFFAGLIPGSGVEPEEGFKMILGYLETFPDALLRSIGTAIVDQPMTQLYKREWYKPATSGILSKTRLQETFGLSDNVFETYFAAGISFLNKSIYLPGRVQASLDEFFRSQAIGGERRALDHRYARQAADEGVLTYDQALADIETNNLSSPIAYVFPQIGAKTQQKAAEQIFAQHLGQGGTNFEVLHNFVQGLRNSKVGVFKLLFPFYGTLVNVSATGASRIPVYNVFVREAFHDIKGLNGKPAQAEALGKLFVGTGIATWAFFEAEAGRLTGSYPAELRSTQSAADAPYRMPKRKYLMDSGWRPYSYMSEDSYRSISGLDPVTMMIQVGADMNVMYHILKDCGTACLLPSEEEDVKNSWLELWEYASTAAMTKIDEQPFAKGFSDTMAFLREDDLRKKAAASALYGNAQPWVSYYQSLRAAHARTEDKFQRNSKAADWWNQYFLNHKRRNSFLTDIHASGGSTSLNPRVNFVGDNMVIYAASYMFDEQVSTRVQSFLMINPPSPEDENPVSKHIRNLGGVKTEYPSRLVSIGVPDEGNREQRVNLSIEQQYAWVTEWTGRNRKVLTPLIKSWDKMEKMPPAQLRIDIIDGILLKNRNAAKELVFNADPSWKEIRDKYPDALKAKGLSSTSDKAGWRPKTFSHPGLLGKEPPNHLRGGVPLNVPQDSNTGLNKYINQ